jgi:transcriptional regulator with XRE-family HTH domain
MTFYAIFFSPLTNMSEKALIKAIGERIRKIREERKIRQTAAGHMAEMDKQHLSLIELGLNAQMFTLYKISTALEWSMAYLLDINHEIAEPRIFRKSMEMDKSTVLKKIGARIITLRKEKNIAEEEFYKMLRKDRQWLLKREAGTVDFTLNTLNLFANGLSVSVSCVIDIYGEIKNKNT